jgi:hypothetical protein
MNKKHSETIYLLHCLINIIGNATIGLQSLDIDDLMTDQECSFCFLVNYCISSRYYRYIPVIIDLSGQVEKYKPIL